MKKKLTIIIIIIVIIASFLAIKISVFRKDYKNNAFNRLNIDAIIKEKGENGYSLYGDLNLVSYLKINISNDGKILFVKKILENNDLISPRVINPNDKNIYIIGNKSNSDDWFSGFITLINEEGIIKWSRNLKNKAILNVFYNKKTKEIVTTNVSTESIYITNIDKNNNIIKENKLNGIKLDTSSLSIPNISRYGYLIYYPINPQNIDTKYKLIKINTKLQKVWEKTYNSDVSISNKLDSNNNYILYGKRAEKGFIKKISQRGSVIYKVEFELLSDNMDIYDLYEVNHNEFLVAGDDKDSNGILLRLDSKGKIIWKQNYEVDTIYKIKSFDDKTLLLLTISNELLEVDKLGNIIWKKEYNHTRLKKFLK